MGNGQEDGSPRVWDLPAEIWREILCFAIGGPQFPIDSFTNNRMNNPSEWPLLPFGWRYGVPLDDLHVDVYAAKYNVSLVCRLFNELAREFLYESLHIRSAGHALRLGEALKHPHGLVRQALGRYTKNLFIIPVYDITTTESDASIVESSLHAMFDIVCSCTDLQSAVVCADSVSLFCEPTYKPWVKILAALPHTLRHIDVRNFLLGPVVWSQLPTLFPATGVSENLVSLRFDAAHPAVEHHFPSLKHLSIFSWPTASKWEMPSLEALYVDYLPDSDLTRAFWFKTGGWPKLRLMHFGCDTDFAMYHADLPRRLAACAPNLEALEYHIAGDADVVWDPSLLSEMVRKVVVKTFQDHNYPRFIYSAVEVDSQEQLEELDGALDNLTEVSKVRWEVMRRHFSRLQFKIGKSQDSGSCAQEESNRRKLVALIPEGFISGFGGDELAASVLRRVEVGNHDSGLSITNINTEALSLWTGISYPSRS